MIRILGTRAGPCRPARMMALLALTLTAGSPVQAIRAALPAAQDTTVPVTFQWLRMAARRPSVLFVGGTRPCTSDVVGNQYCPTVLFGSIDGGTSWTDLSDVPSLGLGPQDETVYLKADAGYLDMQGPVAVSRDGTHVYAAVGMADTTPAYSGGYVVGSTDDGEIWKSTGISPSYDAGSMEDVTPSPAAADQLYAAYYAGDNQYGIASSSTGGATWHVVGNILPGGDMRSFAFPSTAVLPGILDFGQFDIVPDTADARTVYVNLHDSMLQTLPSGMPPVLRSSDAGVTWTPLHLPANSPPLTSFQVSTDPAEPGLLVGQAAESSIPDDRRYYSSDGGLTWRRGVCAGDLHGQCPAFTVQNVFGAGARYAFQPTGIYRFQDEGPAGGRLGISAKLPFDPSGVVDVAAGTTAQSPVYVLSQAAGGVPVRLYRSTDQGQHWQDLTPRMLPNLMPPDREPGARYVPRTGHSVAPPFVKMYDRLGPHLLGYPVTEAYRRGTTLTQDFEHMRLELHGKAVAIGNLGFEVMSAEDQQLGVALTLSEPAPPSTATQMFFYDTGHLLEGAFLRFWQSHDGAALLGPPISEEYQAANGDGSGRVYSMQWFEHGRLELHPENKNPRFRVLLGLVGRDWWGYARPASRT